MISNVSVSFGHANGPGIKNKLFKIMDHRTFSKTIMAMFWLLVCLCLLPGIVTAHKLENPVRLAVVGLTHTHVHWIFNSEKKEDFVIVGIVEKNRALAKRYSDQYGFSMDLVYDSMEKMLRQTKPEGVTAFGSIYEHLEVVRVAAPLGIHVMVEKPLAVNLEHAKIMHDLAKKHNIELLTNYETTWYPSNHKAYEWLDEGKIGALRKVVVHDGHKGPQKIGVDKEFLEWLVDPHFNGGGAITDFGCYGINLMTWLLGGERPTSVTAVTRQFQPENNPLVDDDATIVLNYADTQAVIQPSWNWPIARKDMQLYGVTGELHADNRHRLRGVFDESGAQVHMMLDERKSPYHDPFVLFGSVIRQQITLPPYDLSSLENNMIVMEVLDAAIASAKNQKTITLDDRYALDSHLSPEYSAQPVPSISYR